MKKILLLAIILWNANLFFSQENPPFSQHELSVDFGSLRNRYIFPMTDIRYKTPVLSKIPLQFSVRMRSYGTLFFVTKTAYDFTPIAEYVFKKEKSAYYFTAGLGFDARFRFLNDIRSTATTSVEPLVALSANGNFEKWNFRAPLWTRFYSNGIAFTILPEVNYKFNEKIGLFARYEWSLLALYGAKSHEWRRDLFVGASFQIIANCKR
jgi:hypothetical protein